ncbi:DNA-directed RNA polymerase I subunit RPA34 [Candida viswanathii]|uniref:DNA-directed RNA polymerase I subunit RPA34 n=1 Tax=Candida viswanathii TaxID=5486 RepID=A0A367YCS0_9ASCO|nr:DNA-directed RNA polymerase I subunit RPA34 [Candida viswanathii]
MAPSYKSTEYVHDSDLSSSEDEEEIKEFTPPRNFNKFSSSSSSGKFPSSLKGKEVWLIKTPKGFPLKDLKTLSLAKKNKGNEAIKVNKVSYKVDEDFDIDNDSNNKHTIFASKKSGFKPIDAKISRFYSIHEVVKIPKIDLDKVVVPRANVQKIKKLRMRHFPTGYGAKDYQFDDEEEEDDVSAGKVLKKAKVESKQDEEIEEVKEKKPKKEKKEKKDKKDKKDKKEKKKSKKESS